MDAQFVVAIGDNMYDSGVKDVDDPLFDSVFESAFDAAVLNVPWYVVAGNHDYYGNVTAQIEYTKKSDRWEFPETYYTRDVSSAGIGNDPEEGDVTALLVMLDTWTLCGGDTHVMWNSDTEKGVLRDRAYSERFFKDRPAAMAQLDQHFPTETTGADDEWLPDEEQWEWLNATLAAATTQDWVIVVGHFPVFSATVGEHGSTHYLVHKLQPMLRAWAAVHGVGLLYFSGHDHIMQHIMRDDIHYFGNGAGAQEHVGVNEAFFGLQGYVQGEYGFATHVATKDTLTTSYIADTGKVSYSYSISKAV
jgi:tartrate-resistant acid phosphatase type 5